MKLIKSILFLTAFLIGGLSATAVTDKEMEEARTIATKNYLRYANNGSGYLDEIKVKNMADLEKVLKPKEIENLKVFSAIKVPGDYKSWDKDKLVEFWSVTAFQTKGLSEEGLKARTRTKNQIKAMTIAAPQAGEEKKTEEKKTETPEAEKPAETPVNPVAEGVMPPDPVSQQDSVLQAMENSALAEMAESEEEVNVKKEGSGTWVYIGILSLLVVAVVILVVFASNVLKKYSAGGERNDMPVRYNEGERDETIERLKETLDEKDNEIGLLSKKLESANRQNIDLKKKLEALVAEVSALRNKMNREEEERKTVETRQSVSAPAREERPKPTGPKSIFLGRANAKGIFVRADRNFNPGNSIYKLETTDGISGTFKVVNKPEVWEMALRLPKEYLAFGCIGPDLDDTEGVTMIVNDTPGTAVFEGGCWRVTRKARIHYD